MSQKSKRNFLEKFFDAQIFILNLLSLLSFLRKFEKFDFKKHSSVYKNDLARVKLTGCLPYKRPNSAKNSSKIEVWSFSWISNFYIFKQVVAILAIVNLFKFEKMLIYFFPLSDGFCNRTVNPIRIRKGNFKS